MKFTGTITAISAIASGTSKSGKAWRKVDVVMEYEHGQYPKSIVFSVMNDNIEKFSLQAGGEYEAEVNFTVREYNGRNYMSANAWKAAPIGAAIQPQQAPARQGWQAAYPPQTQSQSQPTPPAAQGDDLPF